MCVTCCRCSFALLFVLVLIVLLFGALLRHSLLLFVRDVDCAGVVCVVLCGRCANRCWLFVMMFALALSVVVCVVVVSTVVVV